MLSNYYAIQTLLKHGIAELPITAARITAILKEYGYEVIIYDLNNRKHIQLLTNIGVYEIANQTKAFTYKTQNQKIVFIRIDVSNNEKRLLLSHELGHIVMNHISNDNVLGYKPGGLLDDGQEDEANAFALEFLAPTCVLAKKHLRTAEDVEMVTLLDEKRSKAVIDEIKKRRKITNYELELCERFKLSNGTGINAWLKYFVGSAAICIIIIIAFCVFIYTISPESNIDEPENIVAATPMPSPTIQPTASPTSVPIVINETDVVITKTGEKYHRPDCRHVKNRSNVVHMTISEAIKAGYEPCADCRPDTN